MTNRETAIERHVAGTKARAAERTAEVCTAFEDCRRDLMIHQLVKHRLTGGIDVQVIALIANAVSPENICRLGNILK